MNVNNKLRKLYPRLIEVSDETQNSIDRFIPDTGLFLRYIKKPPIYDRSTSAAYWSTEGDAYIYQPFLTSLKALSSNSSPQEAVIIHATKNYVESLSSLIRYIEDWGQLIFYRKNLLAREFKKPIKNYRFPLFEHYKWLIGFYRLKAKHHKVRKLFKIRYKEFFGQDINISL